MKNAIVVLTRGYNENHKYMKLISRNLMIDNVLFHKKNKNNNINKKNIDIIIFHEGNITYEQQNFIQSMTPKLELIFKDIKKCDPKNAFDNKKNLKNMDLCPPNEKSERFGLGYKHMCHFWAIDYLYYLKDYKYIIRIDEDCLILKFNHDIFDKMKNDKIYFSSRKWQNQDHDFVTVGLKKTLEEFSKKFKLEKKCSYEKVRCPYTNFMIIDIQYFLNNKMYNKYIKIIDKTHGIYSNRWGDLPIWGSFLSMFIDKKNYNNGKKKPFNEITYIHGSHGFKII